MAAVRKCPTTDKEDLFHVAMADQCQELRMRLTAAHAAELERLELENQSLRAQLRVAGEPGKRAIPFETQRLPSAVSDSDDEPEVEVQVKSRANLTTWTSLSRTAPVEDHSRAGRTRPHARPFGQAGSQTSLKMWQNLNKIAPEEETTAVGAAAADAATGDDPAAEEAPETAISEAAASDAAVAGPVAKKPPLKRQRQRRQPPQRQRLQDTTRMSQVSLVHVSPQEEHALAPKVQIGEERPLPSGFKPPLLGRQQYQCASLWPVWSRLLGGPKRGVTHGSMDLSSLVSVRETLQLCGLCDSVCSNEWEEQQHCLKNYVFHPHSVPIMAWVAISPFLLLFDTTVIPMDDGFALPPWSFLRVMNITVAVYWLLDVARTFFTGFEDNSPAGVEMRRLEVAKRYCKTWFLMDLPLVALDLVRIIRQYNDDMSENSMNASFPARRALRAWRILRMLRLVRVFRFARKVWVSSQSALSMHQLFGMKACFVLIADIFICHYMACYLCALDDGSSDGAWRAAQDVQDAEMHELYVVAANWAVAQSGFSTSSVFAIKLEEHLYFTFVGFVWLVNVSVTISLFVTWMTEVQESRMHEVQEGLHLRQYLEQHDVSKHTFYRCLRFFQLTCQSKTQFIQQGDVRFLRELPVQLQIKLNKEVYLPIVSKNNFFKLLGRESDAALLAICHLAMSEHRHSAGETIFEEGREARLLLCVISGTLDYYVKARGGAYDRLSAGAWCCEPALWTEWVHPGRLVAVSACELVGVDISKVLAVIEESIEMGATYPLLAKHARKTTQFFEQQGIDASDLSSAADICIPSSVRKQMSVLSTALSWSFWHESERPETIS